jgi:glycosyltransferase involved in cell wall biosynthesis
MRMKITMIGTLPPLKGISAYCLELVGAISRHIKIKFINFKSLYPKWLYPGKTKIIDNKYAMPNLENVKIENILTWWNPFSWILAGLRIEGEIVHAQWWAYPLALVYLVILLIAKLKKKKVVITVHNVLPHERGKLRNFLNSVVLFLGDYFIVHTKSNKKDLSRLYNIPLEKIFVIPHGTLEGYCTRGVSKVIARNLLGIPINKKVILYFGNIRSYKGLDILIESIKLVKLEVDNVMLLIAGKPWESWEKYEKLLEENNVSDIVIRKLDFIPPSKVEVYFAASDVVVLPYKHFESQSGVGALALAFKKPLIVTNVGGLPDFVRNKRAIAKPNDVGDLAEKLINVLNNNALLRKLSKDSKELAEKYDWDKIGAMLTKLYNNITGDMFEKP